MSNKSSSVSATAFILLLSIFFSAGGTFARPQPKQVKIVYVTLTIGHDGLALPTPHQPVAAYGQIPALAPAPAPAQKTQGSAYVPAAVAAEEETLGQVENHQPVVVGVGSVPQSKFNPLVDNSAVTNPVVDPPLVENPVVDSLAVNNPYVNGQLVDTITNNPTVNTPLVDTSSSSSFANNPVTNTPTVDPPAAKIIVDPSPTRQIHQATYQHPQKSSTTSKRGLAYNDKSPPLDIFLSHPKITWAHSWSALDFSLPPQLEFVPTLTDLSAYSISHWTSHLQRALSRKTTNPAAKTQYVMSFNEPDQHDQKAFMDPSAAAAAYKKYISPLSSSSPASSSPSGSGIKLGSPSVTNGVVPGMGLNYLSSFLSACGSGSGSGSADDDDNDNDNCPIDFVPIHWYGCPDGACPVSEDIALFKKQITDGMNAAHGKPIWIPEFQRLGDQDGQVEFLSAVLPWLDADEQSQIERYAYFMAADGFLLSLEEEGDNSGRLSKVGEIYVS